MPKVRVELTRSYLHRFLRPARLPFRHFGLHSNLPAFWPGGRAVRTLRQLLAPRHPTLLNVNRTRGISAPDHQPLEALRLHTN